MHLKRIFTVQWLLEARYLDACGAFIVMVIAYVIFIGQSNPISFYEWDLTVKTAFGKEVVILAEVVY